MKLTDNQIKILEFFLLMDPQCYYGYAWFQDETGADRKTLQKEIRGLRELGLVEFMKGLMDDDGMVCGSGFNIFYTKREEVRKLLSKETNPK